MEGKLKAFPFLLTLINSVLCYFVIENTDEERVEALVTITETSTVADSIAYGVYDVDLKNDETIYNYTVTAEGYKTATGEVKQMRTDAVEDVLIKVVLEKATTSLRTALAPQVSVYPNPALNTLNISENVKMARIYNITGALVKEVYDTQTIDVSELNSGVYFLKVNQSHIRFIKK